MKLKTADTYKRTHFDEEGEARAKGRWKKTLLHVCQLLMN